ncbi:acyl-CoA thioesterase [Hyphobacterium sp. CCMP332]|nr:acyl-CoA thioesterase [Hyphobacterium sp. CCMP332]
MFETEVKIRVRYSETDRMGYVYYGHYATYFEVARVEAIREIGFSYKKLEDEHGILLPVRENWSRFIAPAFYDDLLTVNVSIKEMPTIRFDFHYKIFRNDNEHIHSGKTTLVFINKQSGKPCKPPQELSDHLKPYFE